MIEQQYYTRERGGLFSQSDEYDTVAKTPLLKPEYIKRNIHPLCSYDLPEELVRRGETDETKYPPKFLIFPTPTGEMIVGQAVFKSQDYTGLRSTFFMHNFVLSAKEKRRFVKEPEKLFGITGFTDHYNPREGQELPTLAGIPYGGNELYFKDRRLLFNKIRMNEEIFHQLIYAAFQSVHSKRKIIIVLDVPIEELGRCSKALLYHLYLELPWSISEALGVCTYSGKLEAKKSIQITFVDQYTMRYDERTSAEFIFDFVNKRFINMQEDIEAEPYIKAASQYSHNKAAWEKFNRWAEVLSISLKENEKKDVSYYGKVAVLLDMSACLKSGKGYDITNRKIRNGLLKGLFSQFTAEGILEDVRAELSEILEYAITLVHRRIAIGELLSDDELRVLLDFKLKINEGSLEQEAHCVQILLVILEVASRENKIAYMDELFKLIKVYPATYIHLYQAIYERKQLREKIAYRVIDEHLRGITLIEELISAMKDLEIIEPILLSDDYYSQKILIAFHTCLHVADNHMQLLFQVQAWSREHSAGIYQVLREECEGYFVKYASLEEIGSEEALCQIQFDRSYLEENYEVIKDYQRLRTDLSFMSPNKIKINVRVQELIKGYYREKITKDDFYMMVYAFLEPGSEESGPRLNLRKVLEYLYENSLEISLDFIAWSKGQVFYIDQTKFDKQVISFFAEINKEGIKIPADVVKARLGKDSKVKILMKHILSLQKPKLIKRIKAYQKRIISAVLITVGSLAVMGTYCHQEEYNQKRIEEAFNEQVIGLNSIENLIPSISFDKTEVKKIIDERLSEVAVSKE